MKEHAKSEIPTRQAYTKLFVRCRRCKRKNILTIWCFKIQFTKVKANCRYIQSTQFGRIVLVHFPHTVLRQVLHKTVILLRHFVVAFVFRFFSEGSSVLKWFLTFLDARKFFPEFPEVVRVSSFITNCKLPATDV